MERITTETRPRLTESPVPYGPLPESDSLSAGLDYYKPTMSQFSYEYENDVDVTFTLKNRGNQRLLDHIDPVDLQAQFDAKRERGWDESELAFFAGITRTDGSRMFSDDYLAMLAREPLPPVTVIYDEETDDIGVTSTGPHELVTYWETIVMSDINEAYFEGYVAGHGLDLLEIYDEGARRLDEKVAILQSRPDIKIMEFGTRRHFNYRWQRYVTERLANECPDNLIGTSNIALARVLGIEQKGTIAHEEMMVAAALADARGEDIRASQGRLMDNWMQMYGQDLAVALPDTFGSASFFADFTKQQAEEWRGMRHDSGNPVVFGERLIALYEHYDIDPCTKTIIFSDGLDIDEIIRLQDHFRGRINIVFGWGTTLTNDLGIPPLNIVMKATHVHDTLLDVEEDTVKLSDNPGKHTGPRHKIKQYGVIFDALESVAD